MQEKSIPKVPHQAYSERPRGLGGWGYFVVVRVEYRLVIAVTVRVVMMTARLSSREISGT
jgi:hypothetical protein